MKREVYIVFYSTGSYEDFCENIAGVFDNEKSAMKCSKGLDEKWKKISNISEQIWQLRDDLFEEKESKLLEADKQTEKLLEELESRFKNKNSKEYLLEKEIVENKIYDLYDEVEEFINTKIMKKLGIKESVFREANSYNSEYNSSRVEKYELKS